MKLVRGTDTIVVIETQRHRIVYAALSILGGLIAVILGLFVLHELASTLVGILFVIAGLFMGSVAETKTTQLNSDGTITIEYKRVIGHKRWVRKLNRSNILKIDHVKGNLNGTRWLMSILYFDVDSKEQIEIGSRIEKSRIWTIDTEVAEIAKFLNVPVNVISLLGVKNSIKNFYNPHDKMRPLLQRPTQEQLDNEHDGAEDLAAISRTQP